MKERFVEVSTIIPKKNFASILFCFTMYVVVGCVSVCVCVSMVIIGGDGHCQGLSPSMGSPQASIGAYRRHGEMGSRRSQ